MFQPAGEIRRVFFVWHMNAIDAGQWLCSHWRMQNTIILLASAAAVFSYVTDFKPTAQSRIVPEGATMEMIWAKGEFTEGPTLGPDNVVYFQTSSTAQCVLIRPRARPQSTVRQVASPMD